VSVHSCACVLVVYLDAVLPVDHKALQLHDYPKVVKKPMDLGTIQEKLLNGQYDTLREVRILFCFWEGGELGLFCALFCDVLLNFGCAVRFGR